jgi:hypothetical protein
MLKIRSILATSAMLAMLLTACAGGRSVGASPSSTGTPASTAGSSQQHPTSHTHSPVPVESPVPAESNPPGDIPDNTQFVPYRSKAGGFTISVPEGWSRRTTRNSVTFTDKLNTIVVTWQAATAPLTVAGTNSTQVPALRKSERAFRLGSVKPMSLPAGNGVLISYQANSDPNPVTGKQYRLDVLRYELFHHGTEVAIGLRSPVGADNVDPWRIVTQSIRWS